MTGFQLIVLWIDVGMLVLVLLSYPARERMAEDFSRRRNAAIIAAVVTVVFWPWMIYQIVWLRRI
jgi:hypothetical protein